MNTSLYNIRDNRFGVNNILNVHKRNIRVQDGNELMADEKPFTHVKSVGRQYNILDNMSRKFTIKGFSPKTKLDMWDMMAIADSKKKIEEDRKYTMSMK